MSIRAIKSRFDSVNSDEHGAETIQIVLLTTFFVLVVAAVIVALRRNVDSVKVNESFTSYDNVTASSFSFGNIA